MGHSTAPPVLPWIGGPSESSSAGTRHFHTEYTTTAVTSEKMTIDMIVNICFLLFIGNNFGILAASNLGYVLAHMFALSGFVLLKERRRTEMRLLDGGGRRGEWLLVIDVQLEPGGDAPVTLGKTPFGMIGVSSSDQSGDMPRPRNEMPILPATSRS